MSQRIFEWELVDFIVLPNTVVTSGGPIENDPCIFGGDTCTTIENPQDPINEPNGSSSNVFNIVVFAFIGVIIYTGIKFLKNREPALTRERPNTIKKKVVREYLLCSSCGSGYNIGDLFCSECGVKI